MAARHLPFIATAVTVVALDQLTKAIVRARLDVGESWPEGGTVNLTHVRNTGAAFGLLQGETTFLILTTLFGLGAIALYYAMPPVRHSLLGPALGLVLGGATGNLIDRVRMGHVTDFIHFPNYPNFNIADSAITVGIVTLIALMLLVPERRTEP